MTTTRLPSVGSIHSVPLGSGLEIGEDHALQLSSNCSFFGGGLQGRSYEIQNAVTGGGHFDVASLTVSEWDLTVVYDVGPVTIEGAASFVYDDVSGHVTNIDIDGAYDGVSGPGYVAIHLVKDPSFPGNYTGTVFLSEPR